MPDAMFAAWRTRVEAALDRALPDPATSPERLHAAMRHGVLNGGKRMRPMLVYATGRAFGATEADLDAAAVAVPSAEWGEAVGLALVVRGGFDQPGDDEIRNLIRSRLRSSRVPETVRFFAALPYNEMGKLLRREVKVMLAGSVKRIAPLAAQ